ncbi:MAG TPA: transposase [Gaiella sp.]|jgi:REP-associated tyrosine transposase
MTRPPREEAPGAIHHAVPQGNGRRRIVRDDRDRRAYVNRFDRIARDLGWIVIASSLMDTHHHSVVETPEPNLGIGMKRLQGGHARWLNARHGGEGHVFRQRFWSRRIHDDGWLLQACLYVVLNPVAAGMCSHPREWRWGTYTATADGDPDEYRPGEERLLRMFGSTPAEARHRYAEVVDEAVQRIAGEQIPDARALWAQLDGGALGADV